MRFLDVTHPFFVPLWRRIAVVGVAGAWSALEWATGSPFWGTIALGFTGYGIWALLIAFDVEKARRRGQ
ncbi:MAG TPA: hypothetical protein VFR34_11765 [Paracoccaceae bacterium]|nr:hypothetical protein [Paracoccaceae bacterium]